MNMLNTLSFRFFFKRYFAILFVSVSMACFSAFISQNAFAVSSTTPEAPKTAVVATVNIYNAKIVSQAGNDFKISFDLSNRLGIQPGIKYSVMLTKPPLGDVVDQYVYDETLTLGENQKIHKDINYNPPITLSGGTYQLWLKSSNQQSLPLAISNLGNVTLKTVNTPKVEILSDTCYLTVKGEKPVKKYLPGQGVDIKNDETLVATCGVLSTLPSKSMLQPIYKTNRRTIFGDTVKQTGGTIDAVSIESGKSIMSFELPKATEPQAYDVSFSLESFGKLVNISSNSVVFHYVLRGVSGTIQNSVFDKSSYVKGDTAKLQVILSAAADSFPSSRLGTGTDVVNQILKIQIVDKSDVACSQTKTEEIVNKVNIINVSIPIINDCGNPIARVSFEGSATASSGSQTLDTKDFDGTPVNTTSPSTKGGPLPLKIMIAIVGLIIVIIFYAYISKKNQ